MVKVAEDFVKVASDLVKVTEDLIKVAEDSVKAHVVANWVKVAVDADDAS